MKKPDKKYNITIIAMSGLIIVTLGLILKLSGLFFKSMSADLCVSSGQISMTLSITNIISAFSGLYIVRKMTSDNLQSIIRTGTLLVVLPTIVMAFADNIYYLYILSTLRGFGAGMIGPVLVTVIIGNWFISKQAIVTSIVFGSSGIIGAVFSPIISYLILNIGWRKASIVSGLIMLAFCLPAAILQIPLKPEIIGLKPYEDNISLTDADKSPNPKEAETISPSTTTILTVIVVCIFSLSVALPTSLPHHYAGLSASYSFPETIGALMISACMIVNTVGKLLFGIISEKTGFGKAMFTYLLLSTLGVFLLLINNIFILFTAALCFGFSYSLITVGLSILIRKISNGTSYSKLYSKANVCTTLGCALGVTLIGMLYDYTNGYSVSIVLITVMLLADILIYIKLISKRKGI